MKQMSTNDALNTYQSNDFTFVVCAYKESPYLEECIQSLKNQTIQTNIIVVTSTPSNYIKEIVLKYNLPYYINDGRSGIAEDWNYGYSKSDARIVCIAHQDDIYCSQFAERAIVAFNESKHPLISFCDYGEIRDGEYVTKNQLLDIKRKMLFPLRWKRLHKSRFVRRRILSFGSAICCPSVTFVKDNLPKEVFTPGYRSDVDWQAWERLSRYEGDFVFINDILMYHRIHRDSATTEIIADNDRTKEDYEMFCKFWPAWIAKIIEHFYKRSESSNET